jgi:hypothetical protein
VAQDLLLEQQEPFEIRARALKRDQVEEEPVTAEVDAVGDHDDFANFSAPV